MTFRSMKWLLVCLLAACGDNRAAPDAPPDAMPDAYVETCPDRRPLPVATTYQTGFTRAEDFAFDAQGRYVGVNDFGDLVRITREGVVTVWVPNLGEAAGGAGTAGMRFLPNGDLVVAIVDTGSLVRVTPDGNVSTILSGLAYPNGLDIDNDGNIYVAENNAGRVRKVDAATGAFRVIAVGLCQPNGVALSATPGELFVGSFGCGTIYRITLDETAAARSTVSTFGHVPGTVPIDAIDPCATLELDATCDGVFGPGRCVEFGGRKDCQPAQPCDGKLLGDKCETEWATPGECIDDGVGGLVCSEINQCNQVGDECSYFGEPGICVEAPDGPVCSPKPPCLNLDVGASCMLFGDPGVCTDVGVSELVCAYATACGGLSDGDSCFDFWRGLTGTCDAVNGSLYCVPQPPCAGLSVGDTCTFEGQSGVCQFAGAALECVLTQPCQDAMAGDACLLGNGAAGLCTAVDGLGLQCVASPVCEGLMPGAVCNMGNGQSGACTQTPDGLLCLPATPCSGLAPGDACDEGGEVGRCVDLWGTLECAHRAPCNALQPGQRCDDGNGGDFELCQPVNGDLVCAMVPPVCFGVPLGSACDRGNGLGKGICADVGTCVDPCADSSTQACLYAGVVAGECADGLQERACVPTPGCEATQTTCVTTNGRQGTCEAGTCVVSDCAGLAPGDACGMQESIWGVCDAVGACVLRNDCQGQSVGQSCVVTPTNWGTCSDLGGEVACLGAEAAYTDACAASAIGAACSVSVGASLLSGICAMGDVAPRCLIVHTNACDGSAVGDACSYETPTGSVPGQCTQRGPSLECLPTSGTPGGLDGIAVDACGYVYVTEYTTGKIYRLDPSGGLAALAAVVDNFWIPNMHWGTGVGGFEKNILYVADRDDGGLHALEVGVPGAPEAFPKEIP